MPLEKKSVHIYYYAALREERGINEEVLETNVSTALQLYNELKKQFHFKLSTDILRVAINDEFVDWQTKLKNKDSIVFIPPVAGG